MNTPDPGRAPAPRRRGLLMAGIALGAALAGGGLAWRRLQPAATSEGAVQALWSQSFDRPDGGSLTMAGLRGRRLLINFWATWCPPCIEELPLLDAFHREHAPKGWQVIGLAIDQPSAVRKFLARTPVGFPIGLAGMAGTDLGKSLGNLSGGLPFTVVIGQEGRILQRKMGKLSAEDLVQWAAASAA